MTPRAPRRWDSKGTPATTAVGVLADADVEPSCQTLNNNKNCGQVIGLSRRARAKAPSELDDGPDIGVIPIPVGGMLPILPKLKPHMAGVRGREVVD